MSNGVQIVTELAERITRLFDDAGASQVERYSALDVARALIPVSLASISSCEPYHGRQAALQPPAQNGNEGT